jgi:protein-S-isoprenylcysteine O-methyltransferase Ste14
MNQQATWRWRNLPVPEQHVGGLALSLLLHKMSPRRIGRALPLRIGGGVLFSAGVALAVWATIAAAADDLEHPESLVTSGPYAHSRNPMYVGWTLGYVGVAGLANSAWPLVGLPGVAAAMHREVRREEDRLRTRFGPDFEAYRSRVRRYL